MSGTIPERSFPYIRWGSHPTNFELCPNNFICPHTNFCGLSMQFDYKLAAVHNTFTFEGFTGIRNVKLWLSHRNHLASAAFCLTNFVQKFHSCQHRHILIAQRQQFYHNLFAKKVFPAIPGPQHNISCRFLCDRF